MRKHKYVCGPFASESMSASQDFRIRFFFFFHFKSSEEEENSSESVKLNHIHV